MWAHSPLQPCPIYSSYSDSYSSPTTLSTVIFGHTLFRLTPALTNTNATRMTTAQQCPHQTAPVAATPSISTASPSPSLHLRLAAHISHVESASTEGLESLPDSMLSSARAHAAPQRSRSHLPTSTVSNSRAVIIFPSFKRGASSSNPCRICRSAGGDRLSAGEGQPGDARECAKQVEAGKRQGQAFDRHF